MTMNIFEIWIEDLVELFDTNYGTTRFFSNPYEAQTFVEDNFLKNPRLSEIEKTILLENSKNALEQALSDTNDPQQAALNYWRYMQDYILLNTSDQRIQNVFETGSQAAEDTANLTFDEDVEETIKLPWWLLLFPLAILFVRKK
jgi:hypothetical protein